MSSIVRLRLKCDGTRAETRFRLSAKWTSPFKSAGASVHSTPGSQGVHISSSNAGYTMFRGSVKSIGYPLHSPVSPSLPLPCVTACQHISAGFYLTLACLSYNWQRQIYLPLVCYPQTFDCVSFLSSVACYASRTVCYYEGGLLYPIKGKKGEGLPLEFTYSECQCQKSAVFSTSVPAVIDVKVTLRP